MANDSNVSEVSPPITYCKPGDAPARDWRFWLIFVSLMVSTFMFALEAVAVGNALPSIVHRFNGTQFIWVGCARGWYPRLRTPLTRSRSSTLPKIAGRRAVMLGALAFFAVGSAVSGAASSMNVLIVGRTIQGVGGGAIVSVTQIILSDLVPLRERGTFSGLIAIAFTIASCIGPVVGGSLAQNGQWRWLFYLNIPISGVTAALTLAFLKLKTPPGSAKDKLKYMDWM
ncbi:hypothetical protein EVG20_g1505 [Dentipellis fragilis]|uniref:Major facilitator superfamily (MFS) profile domain-containing protein n=1 Tax=Dentipellis fragilis TaxID=205917 RepID=A0A4Y9ZCJ4_9AGAM|nr:hypothetical protein EVG20_g1505 [Dentipellis fragilis]